MKPAELANYAILKPEVFGWYYYMPKETISTYIEKLRSEKVPAHKASLKLVNVVSKASFGAICWLLYEESITNMQFMNLVNKLEKLNPIQLTEFYNTLESLVRMDDRNYTTDIKADLVKGIGQGLDKSTAKKVKKALKAADDEQVWNIVKKLKDTASSEFASNNADSSSDIRFHAPDSYKAASKELDELPARIAAILTDTPSVAMEYFGRNDKLRAERVKQLEEMGAPDVILYNEQKLWRENRVSYLLASLVKSKMIGAADVRSALKEYFELEHSTYNAEEAHANSDPVNEFVKHIESMQNPMAI